VFNLVPAAPLDGGRVLRAAVWKFSGDRPRAGLVTARAGRVFGVLLIALGLGDVLLFGSFGGLWWVLLGWFLGHAAVAEQSRARRDRRLYGVRVADVMSPPPVAADPDTSVEAFVDGVLRHGFPSRPLMDAPLVDADGRLTGLVTPNLIRAVPPQCRSATRLADIACADIACQADRVPALRPDEPLLDALPRLDGRAVVVDDAGRVVGLVSPRDISRWTAVNDLCAAGPYPLPGADPNAGRRVGREPVPRGPVGSR
jgi:CBS domain-containing protein